MKYILLVCLLVTSKLAISNISFQIAERHLSDLDKSTKTNFLSSFIEGNQVYLNIPEELLEETILFVRYDHNVQRKYLQVKWTLHKNQMLLKALSVKSSAGVVLPFKPKLEQDETIIGIFPTELNYGIEGIYCINVTDFLLGQNIEWSPGFSETVVPQIGVIMDNKDLVDEVLIKTQRGILFEQSKISIPMYFSFCALPKPMASRLYDYRMGFYNERIDDIIYGTKNSIANISRRRLEKRNKDQEVSVPIKPITFIMSPDIPQKWRPYVKAGIEEWLPAFEAIGFKDAIVVKDVDSLNEWQAFSIHNSIIYWGKEMRLRGAEDGGFGGTVANVIDERSGEILKGDVFISNSREAYSEKYFIRAAPLDRRAQNFPYPDDLLGELYQCMVAHEVGHAFGLMDSHYGEFAYPFEKMNDVEWLKTMGHTPSVMNYTRQNNIAQPEDSIPPRLLHQKVGPMDRYQISWAYTEFSPGSSTQEEKAALEEIIRLQDTILWYRYNHEYGLIGPATTDEVVENRDPVRSTEMAMKNLKRTLALLPNACKNDNDNARLERLYDGILELWYLHMQHVVSLVGGVDIHYKSINQLGMKYTPIPWASQKEALNFIMEHVMQPPNWLTNPEFAYRIHYTANRDKILEYQQRLVLELFNSQRLKRLEYSSKISGFEGIFIEYLDNLQSELFREVYDEDDVQPRNREIQLTYIDMWVRTLKQDRLHITVDEKMYDYTDYSKGIMMEQLLNLKKDIIVQIKRSKNKGALGHWNLCLLKLSDIYSI
ncbi:MAG: zinc-dependent metalloprotease [Gelidibacter sp.]